MPESYVSPPVAKDPAALAAEIYELIQTHWPNWQPKVPNLEVLIIEGVANLIAGLREQASDVPAEIFAYLGGSILGVPRNDAVEAIAETTWTMKDNAGYTVEQGTYVGIPVTGSEVQPFEVVADIVVAPGSTQATGVELRAVNEGEAANDADGVPYLLDAGYDFVTAIALTSGPSGGEDQETPQAYLDRLVARFQLLRDGAVLAADFATLAMEVDGVDRATAFDNMQPGDNEIQRLTRGNLVSAGTFTISWQVGATTYTTAAIAWNASADAVRAALEAMNLPPVSPIDSGDVIVDWNAVSTYWTIEFAGKYAGTNVNQVTVDSGGLTGGAVTPTTTQTAGAATVVDKEITVAVADEDGEPVSSAVSTAVQDELEAKREANFVVNVVDPAYTTVDVDYVVVARAGAVAASVEADCDAALADFLNPGMWGRQGPEHADWEQTDTVRINELIALLDDVESVSYVTSVEIAAAGATTQPTDLLLAGIAPLPRSGTLNGTVN